MPEEVWDSCVTFGAAQRSRPVTPEDNPSHVYFNLMTDADEEDGKGRERKKASGGD